MTNDENLEEDIVTPWDVKAEGVGGVDYAKLTSKLILCQSKSDIKFRQIWLSTFDR